MDGRMLPTTSRLRLEAGNFPVEVETGLFQVLNRIAFAASPRDVLSNLPEEGVGRKPVFQHVDDFEAPKCIMRRMID